MSQLWANLGTGGTALDARNGSGTGVDSNDAKLLEHDGTNYVYLPGVAGNYLVVGNDAAFNVTGDAEWIIDVAMDDWTPSAAVDLVIRGNADPNRAFQVRLQTNGTVGLSWWPSGSSASGISVASTGTVPFADGQRGQIKISLDVDNGSGQYAVTMATSTDNTTWTPLTMPAMPTVGTTSLPSVTAAIGVFYGDFAGAQPFSGKGYRFRMLNGIGGLPVLDVDTSVITSGAATSFTATTGQTVTISRSTSGRKSVAVVNDVWLLGTANYLEIADNDLLDFGASDSFTVMAVVRAWNTQATGTPFVVKRVSGGAAEGWTLRNGGGSLVPNFLVDDGPDQQVPSGPTVTAGALSVLSGVLNRSTAQASAYNGATAGSAVSTTAIGSLENTAALRIGATLDPLYGDFECMAVAVFRRALTAGEISALSSYYASRFP